jgi:ABC-type phosphate transport system substrate-binding protein
MSPIKQAAAAVVLSTALATSTAAADVAAVVSAKSAVSAATPQQIADIYLGRSSRFPDGTPAVPCDLAEGSPTREEFYAKIVGKSAAQMKAHWAKIIFTGRGQPPREVANSEEAKKLVQSNPQTVCYIDSTAVDKSVNVLFIR